jgi:putative DNA primase/helicase
MKNYPASRPTKRAPTQVSVGHVVRELELQLEEVAVALLGEPSRRSCREFRWGQHGSLWLCCTGKKRGRWYDHERGQGGDLLDLIARERDVSLKDAITIASDVFGGAKPPNVRRRRPSKRLDNGTAQRTAMALRLWHQSAPINGTSAENYFNVERQLAISDFSLAHALRWHSGIGAIVALMTDPVTGEAIGIHRTFLDRSGTKLIGVCWVAKVWSASRRMMRLQRG